MEQDQKDVLRLKKVSSDKKFGREVFTGFEKVVRENVPAIPRSCGLMRNIFEKDS